MTAFATDEMPEAVSVTISTNVDLKRDVMTDEDWMDLGKYVADCAERARTSRNAAARATPFPADG